MMKKLFIYISGTTLCILLLLTIALMVTLQLPQFGGTPDQVTLQKMANSANFNGKVFNNLLPTTVSTISDSSPSTWQSVSGYLWPPANKNPKAPINNQAFDPLQLEENQLVWLGHSTVYFRTAGVNIVTDPVFYRASPIPLGGKPFQYKFPVTSDSVKNADVVVISHDHYDHLEMRTIKALSASVHTFLVPLGVKAHLQKWGVDSEKIVELDWYESTHVRGVKFVLTPARHFSGRGLSDRYETLWGSWVIKSDGLNVYFSGDGGYSPEFKKVGELHGPFDVALMESGAYDKDWNQIHMFPEQAIQAAMDINAKTVLPIHWGKFDLARHNWLEPLLRSQVAANQSNISLLTPKVGEVISLRTK